MTRKWLSCSVAVAAILGGIDAAAAQGTTPAAMDSLLQRLAGSWSMVGSVRGKPAEYRMEAVRTLQNRFLELHMVDVARPPSYEARVFIGVDSDAARYIVHWMDSTGAAYSIPHGVGSASGDTIRFTFAYADGPFRDQFLFDRRKDEWRFHLESGDSTGVWRPFADYVVRRR